MEYRHGDIAVRSVRSSSGGVLKHNGSFVLAEGEATGHHHVISTERPEDLIIQDAGNGLYYFTLKSVGTLTHQEHKTLKIQPGTYKTGREREVDYFSKTVRRVID